MPEASERSIPYHVKQDTDAHVPRNEYQTLTLALRWFTMIFFKNLKRTQDEG